VTAASFVLTSDIAPTSGVCKLGSIVTILATNRAEWLLWIAALVRVSLRLGGDGHGFSLSAFSNALW
jgi:hypothetical protein